MHDHLEIALKKPLWCTPDDLAPDTIKRTVLAQIERSEALKTMPMAIVVVSVLTSKFPCRR